MKKYFIFPLLLVLAVGLSAPLVFAQNTGSVKGTCKDVEGKPIAQAEVEWVSTDTGHKYNLKTNNKGEYFSLGINPGRYNVKLSKDGKELFHFNGVPVSVDEVTQDFDLKKEQANAAQAQGLTPEQAAKAKEAISKAENEKKTVGALNEKLNAAKTASDAGDFETAIATLNEATQIDSARDLLWFKLADAYRMSAPKQTDPEEKKKRYEMAAADYQKAIEMRSTSEAAQKDPDNNKNMAAYYNNLAEVYSKSNKVDDSVANYNKAAQLDPAHAGTYLFNEGAVLTNAGRVDDANAVWDKVIAADPTKAEAYYQKGLNLLIKETIGKDGKAIAPEGTAEAFQKYLELAPNGRFAQSAKDLLASIGATVETGFGTKKKPAK
ncbi:MAG TPA: carboxypeptidase regulatory-like domain-containing protein [Candidatus Acidoferrum sp.]|nr:carboxypeptidase regulatory-like domain-containing protein [Candidatus Acidoferrum sp.]